jgi:uncharacterized 2Fe-2S/4Fe-4S cluster protein (DUF4445 family)
MSNHVESRQQGFEALFLPDRQRIRSLPGETLLDSARRAGVRIASICGGRGLCKSCVIKIISGPAADPSDQDSEFFSATELRENWRRACQTFLCADSTIEVSARAQAAPSRTQVASEDVYVRRDPAIRTCRVAVPAATLKAPKADDQRLMDALKTRASGIGHSMDVQVLRTLSRVLRDSDGSVVVVDRFGEIIGLLPPSKHPLVGIAIDLGTTNIGVLLVDLSTGKTLESRGLENPQIVHGGDVVTRIGYARSSPAALEELRTLVVDSINDSIADLCHARSIDKGRIADLVIAGNTTMHHLLLGLPVESLGKVPFVAGVANPANVKARDVGIDAMAGAYVHLLPNIAGFVGGDHTAVLLTIAGDREKQTVVVLDIGTNTEISLIHEGRLSSLSCPSGPALEGGHIKCGMRSAPGAIEAVEITADGINIKTIDDQPAIGICGSGVLDITAQLYSSGVANAGGRILDNHPRVRTVNKQREFVLVDERESNGQAIVFPQSDVRAVQLAKGAIHAGIRILLEDAGLSELQLDQVIIAGAFGSYLNLRSAIAIGMLPDLPLERFAQIGNAAGIGAKLALVSHPHRAAAQQIALHCNYVELAGTARFNSAFMRSIGFHVNPPRQKG